MITPKQNQQIAIHMLCMHRDWLVSQIKHYKIDLEETELLLKNKGVHIATLENSKNLQGTHVDKRVFKAARR